MFVSYTLQKMDYVQLGLNLCVIGASVFGVTQLEPTAHPYGFAAAAFCLVQGVMDFMKMIQGDGDCGGGFSIGNCIVSFLPLPLANIEFYAASGQANWALVHSLSLILIFYKSVERMSYDGPCPIDITADLSLILNAASAVQLFVAEGDLIHLGIGLGALFTRYGWMLLELICPSIDFALYMDKLGRAAIIAAMTYGLEG